MEVEEPTPARVYYLLILAPSTLWGDRPAGVRGPYSLVNIPLPYESHTLRRKFMSRMSRRASIAGTWEMQLSHARVTVEFYRYVHSFHWAVN